MMDILLTAIDFTAHSAEELLTKCFEICYNNRITVSRSMQYNGIEKLVWNLLFGFMRESAPLP
jgi:hypothetical protein